MNKKTLKKLAEFQSNGLIQADHLPQLEKVVAQYSLAMTDDMHQLIDKSNLDNDPIAKQFVPSIKELTTSSDERADPIGDETHQAVKGIVHRYPDRCLFTPVHICPIYCRFCFRREKVGDREHTLTPQEMERAFQYIENNQAIWEVILTGGDPLILKADKLRKIMQRLAVIQHVDVIRLHTRIPVVDTARITDELVSALKCGKAVYVILHANHAREFTPKAIEACNRLIDAGIPMLSQTVLLKDINDNIATLSDLMRTFVSNRIKPYYLHHADLAKGTQHFRTSIADGQALMKQLRGRYSGLCQPTYVLDIPGGCGKVPIGPQYVVEKTDQSYVMEDYCGDQHSYNQH